jgi:hypothetical protein
MYAYRPFELVNLHSVLGLILAIVFAPSMSAQTCVDGAACNPSSLNKIVFVDGIHYPATENGLQSAISDAMSSGNQEVRITQAITLTGTLTINPSGSNTPGQVLDIVLEPGVTLTCAMASGDCIDTAGPATIRGEANGFGTTQRPAILLASGASVMNVLGIPSGISGQGPTLSLRNLYFDIHLGAVSGSVVDVCGQDNGGNVADVSILGGASGTYSLLTIDNKCNSVNVSNGAGRVENSWLNCNNVVGCTPLTIPTSNNASTYEWDFIDDHFEFSGAGRNSIAIGVGSGNVAPLSVSFLNCSAETYSVSPPILINGASNIGIYNFTFYEHSSTATTTPIVSVTNTNALNFTNITISNLNGGGGSGNVIFQGINNSVSGKIIATGTFGVNVPLYVYTNSAWNLAFQPYFDGGAGFTSLSIDGTLSSALANLNRPNGSIAYCSDCMWANPCKGGGSGALAKKLGGVWVCN